MHLPPADPERLRAWSYHRQLLGAVSPDPATALHRVVAVYSAHPTAPLSLGARVRDLTPGAFRALEEQRLAVRIVAMRGSGFLVPLELADDLVAATRRAGALTPAALRARGLDEADYRDLKPRILEATRRPMTPAQLDRALGTGPGDRRAYFAMRLMAREALIVRVGAGRLRTDDLRWVATDAWLGRPLGEVDPAAAVARLAAAYLAAYGPARVEDLAWWAGLPRRRAAAALAAVTTLDVGGGLLLRAADRDAWRDVAPVAEGAIDVLPKWDPYTMGHAPDGRARLVDDAHLDLAYSTAETRVGATAGDGLPLVLRNGRAVAAWSHRLEPGRIAVAVRPFVADVAAAGALLEGARPAFAAIGRLLDDSVDVRLAGP